MCVGGWGWGRWGCGEGRSLLLIIGWSHLINRAVVRLHDMKTQNKVLLIKYGFVLSCVSASLSISILIYEMGILVPNEVVMKNEWEYICIYTYICIRIYIYVGMYVCICTLCLVTQSCLTLWDPMDCSPPAPLSTGILQARILEWVAMPCSRGYFWPGIKPRSPSLQADSLPSETPGKSKNTGVGCHSLLQGIFPTQESNRGLLHCRQILHQLSYQESPRIWIHIYRYILFWTFSLYIHTWKTVSGKC